MNYAQRKGKSFFEEEYILKERSIRQIAESEGTTSTTIRSALKFHKIPARKQKTFTDVDILTMQQYAKSHSIQQTATYFGIHYQTAYGHVIKSDSVSTPPHSKQQLTQWYSIEGLSGPNIATMLGVNPSTVYNWLSFYDINTSVIPFYDIITRDELLQQYYIDNVSTSDIAALYNVEVQKVVYALHHHNIDIRPTGWKNIVLQDLKNPTTAAVRDEDNLKKLKVDYTNREIAAKYQINESIVQYYCSKYQIQSQFTGSSYERQLHDWLDDQGIEYLTNQRTVLTPKEVDIYIPSANLAIEINGCYWHSPTTQTRITKNYHKEKTQLALDANVKLMHIWDHQMYNPVLFDIIKSKIKYKCGLISDRLYARKCVISCNVDTHIQKQFQISTHIQGYRANNITYGLYESGKLVALIGLHKIHDGVYDLSRYSSIGNVVGGFQKLLKAFLRDFPNCTHIETYANMMFTTSIVDNVYTTSGFEFIEWTDPNYFYAKGNTRVSRHKCMKHRLSSWLPSFDQTLSEYENMVMNGWYRVYDCGHAKYMLHVT